MPDQADAEILQILGRQARQYPRVDLVRAERRLVLLEPKTAQPFRDIHRPHLPFGPIIVPKLLERTISVHPPGGEPLTLGAASPPRKPPPISRAREAGPDLDLIKQVKQERARRNWHGRCCARQAANRRG